MPLRRTVSEDRAFCLEFAPRWIVLLPVFRVGAMIGNETAGKAWLLSRGRTNGRAAFGPARGPFETDQSSSSLT